MATPPVRRDMVRIVNVPSLQTEAWNKTALYCVVDDPGTEDDPLPPPRVFVEIGPMPLTLGDSLGRRRVFWWNRNDPSGRIERARCHRLRTLAASFPRLTSAIRLLIVTVGIQVMHATQELGPNSSTKSRASPVHETGGHSRNGSVTNECLFYKVAKKNSKGSDYSYARGPQCWQCLLILGFGLCLVLLEQPCFLVPPTLEAARRQGGLDRIPPGPCPVPAFAHAGS